MESKSALEIAKYTLPMGLLKVKVGGGHLLFLWKRIKDMSELP